MKTVPLIGYTNKISGRAGDIIEFKISSKSESNYQARLFRSISADPNPALGGVKEIQCDSFFTPISRESKEQKFFPGSFAKTTGSLNFQIRNSFKLSCRFFPTLLFKGVQSLLSISNSSLEINESGYVLFSYYDKQVILKQIEISPRKWYEVEGGVSKEGTLSITLKELSNLKKKYESTIKFPTKEIPIINDILFVAAKVDAHAPFNFFNGKIEAPCITADQTQYQWDFSKATSTTRVPHQSLPELDLINYPTRAVTSSLWDASEMNWNHKPEHYCAIHFHEDDIYDFNWKTSFTFKIPAEMDSGIYVMRINCGDNYDAIPFFVCPPKNENRSRLCILVSTFTYSIYGNHARPDFTPSWNKKIKEWSAYPYNPAEFESYGLSTYNYHSDGSGICYSSTNRPLFNIRPGYLTFGNSACSGLRHFQADSHLISWLHAKNIKYDIITDNELDEEGYDAIKGYTSLTTGTHPEYHTSNTLDALMKFRNSGGFLNYLGGNGFYWKIARQEENQNILEIRRAEDGIRAWASEPGEYYNSFDGKYGGLWRRNGRPPQQLVGVGFTAQGRFVGMPFKRTYYKKELDWIFNGITDELLGDFGFSGNGAAGFELDRVDSFLDEGHDIHILAQSFDINKKFMLVPEEQLTHLTNVSGGPEDNIRRADMIYFEVEGGGSVFSVGSITFCGSLPWNNFNNNISKLLSNILAKQLN